MILIKGGFVLWSLGIRYYFPWTLPHHLGRTFGDKLATDIHSKFIRSLIGQDPNCEWKFFEEDDGEAETWKSRGVISEELGIATGLV